MVMGGFDSFDPSQIGVLGVHQGIKQPSRSSNFLDAVNIAPKMDASIDFRNGLQYSKFGIFIVNILKITKVTKMTRTCWFKGFQWSFDFRCYVPCIIHLGCLGETSDAKGPATFATLRP